MRITQQQTISNAIVQSQARQLAIADLQDQLATGLRIRQASDAPAEWSRLTATKASLGRIEVNLENISTVEQRLNHSVSSLTEAGNILVRARELALAGNQTEERESLALEVDRLIEAMISIANSADGGVQLYSGTASNGNAFEIAEVDELGRPTQVRYRGSNNVSNTIVGDGTYANVLPSGADIFQQQSRGKSEFIGHTGATAGKGTDSAKGVGALQVRNTSTTYSNPIVSSGASAQGGDTIIGPPGVHTLTIENSPTLGPVVSLNGGGPIPFDASSRDLKVVGHSGAVVFVDLSAVPDTFAGDIEITANGNMSIDGGQTEEVITFSESQVLTHSHTGEVTVVDSVNIRNTGEDRIEYTGTNGVFEAMLQLRDDLQNSDGVPTPEFVNIMDARISDIKRAHDQVIEFVGEQSVELSNLQTLGNKTREVRLVLQETLADIENADVADVIVRLQTEQNHLQFIYAATASMNQTSLLDFIR